MTEPSGFVALASANMRSLIAKSTAFQEWIGGNEAAALLRVHEGMAPANATRPLAVVVFPDGDAFGGDRVAFGTWTHSGTLGVFFEQAVDSTEASAFPNVQVDFTTTIGKVLGNMEELSVTEGLLEITSYRNFTLELSDDDRNDKFWLCGIEFKFGLGE